MLKIKNKKLVTKIFLSLFIGIIFFGFFSIETSFATESSTRMQDIAKEKAMDFGVIGYTVNRMLWPMLFIIGGLLDNSLIFEGGMENILREIWVQVRNIVNILFIILLVGIALYNVLGLGDENSEYSLKSILPKIIIGIIAVNFSFLGLKIFLDGINVLTTSVFMIPAQVTGKSILEDEEQQKAYCRNYFIEVDNEIIKSENPPLIINAFQEIILRKELIKILPSKRTDISKMSMTQLEEKLRGDKVEENQKNDIKEKIDKDKFHCTGELKLNTPGKAYFQNFDGRNAVLAMAINMGNIWKYEEMTQESLQNLEKLAVNAIASLVFYLVYALSFLALAIVLIARVVFIWLALVMSPIMVLIITIPIFKDKLGNLGELSTKFIQTAIAPLLIAISLSLGWIMIGTLKDMDGTTFNRSIIDNSIPGMPIEGMTTPQDIIANLAVLGIIWLGVFSAASNTIAGSITEGIKGTAQTIGKKVVSWPIKHAPILPVKLGDTETNLALGDLSGIPSMFEEKTRIKQRKRLDPLRTEIFGLPSQVTSVDIAKQTTEDGLKGVLYRLNQRGPKALATKDVASQLQIFKDKNNREWEAIRSSLPDDLKSYLDTLANPRATDEQREKASEALHSHIRSNWAEAASSQTDSSDSGSDSSDSGSDSSDSGQTSTYNISLGTNIINENGNQEKLGDLLSGTEREKRNQVREIQTSLNNLTELLSQDDPDKDEVQKAITELSDAGGGALKQGENLKVNIKRLLDSTQKRKLEGLSIDYLDTTT